MPGHATSKNAAGDEASSAVTQEREVALQAMDTAQRRVVILEKELTALKSELDRYLVRINEMESAWQEAKMARDSITRHFERLMKSIARTTR
jgi:chromosome segregation ATPase